MDAQSTIDGGSIYKNTFVGDDSINLHPIYDMCWNTGLGYKNGSTCVKDKERMSRF